MPAPAGCLPSVATPRNEPQKPEAKGNDEALETTIAKLEAQNAKAILRIHKLKTDLDAARAQVAWFHRQLFGQKAEHVPKEDLKAAFVQYIKDQEDRARGLSASDDVPIEKELASLQLLMDFLHPESEARTRQERDEVETPSEAPASETAQPPASTPRKRKGHGRKPIPEHFEQECVVIEPDEIPKGARQVDVDVSYRLAIRPARYVRLVIIRPKYAVDNEDATASKIIVAPPPHEMIPRGLMAPSGLANILAGHYDRHVPYHRMDRFFGPSGYTIPVSTLSGVAIRAAPLAKDLVKAMAEHAQKVAPYLAIDATGVKLQHPERCLRGHVWLRYIEETCVLVSFTTTHDSKSAGAQLDGFDCPTLADGAQVYDAKHRETHNARAGCWSHGRRKLVYAAPTDGRSLVGVHFANQLFAIERGLLEVSADERLAARRARSAPIVDELFRWRDDLLARGRLGRSVLSGALRYLRNQERRLMYFLSDGRIPIHNNLTELQARHLAVGRKNWVFFGSVAGAEAGSVWLSLVLSARMHGLDVELYLRDLFRVLPQWPKSRILELAPHAWSTTRSRLDPAQMSAELGALSIPPPP